MTKKKKTSAVPPDLPRRLRESLDEASDLMVEARWTEARRLLEELARTYPGQYDVLAMLVNCCHELHDLIGYQNACERLNKLDPRNPELHIGLAVAYATNGFPALAERTYHEVLRRYPDRSSDQKLRELFAANDKFLVESLAEIGASKPEGLHLLELHEHVRIHLGRAEYSQARRAADELIRHLPAFAPVRNNLTQAYAADGYLAEAIAAARQVLEFDPGNIHALSNLTRCHCLMGQFDQARTYADQMLASPNEAVDGWLKKMEALTYLGDDQRVLDIFGQARQVDDRQTALSDPMLWHLAAVAAMRLGQESTARDYWKESLKRGPGFELAQDNLNDLKKPVAQHNAPWAFEIREWVSPATVDEMARIIRANSHRKAGALKAAMQRFLQRHPELAALAPILLDRTGPAGRETILLLAQLCATPDLLKAVNEFAFGQLGSDELRMQAAQIVAHAGLLSTGLHRMWMEGRWQDVLLMAFEVDGEPVHAFPHRPDVERLLHQNIEAAGKGELAKAEALIKQALSLEPDKPDLQNNLAAVYEATGRKAEARAMWEAILEHHPDYLFARVGLARMAIFDAALERAHAFVDPLFGRKRLHFSEFSALCATQVELLLAEKKTDSARSWFELWEQGYSDDPKLEHYRRLVTKAPHLPDWLDRRPRWA